MGTDVEVMCKLYKRCDIQREALFNLLDIIQSNCNGRTYLDAMKVVIDSLEKCYKGVEIWQNEECSLNQ